MKQFFSILIFTLVATATFAQTTGKFFSELPTMSTVDNSTWFVTLDGTPKVWKKFGANTLRSYVNPTVTSIANATVISTISNPYEGDLAINNNRDTLWIRATSSWIIFKAGTSSGGGGSTPSLQSVLAVGNSANSLKITNLATPTSTADAATKGYVDTQISGVSDAANTYSITVSRLTVRDSNALLKPRLLPLSPTANSTPVYNGSAWANQTYYGAECQLAPAKPSPLTTKTANVVIDTTGSIDSFWVWNTSKYILFQAGGVTDGNKGVITVSNNGQTWILNNASIASANIVIGGVTSSNILDGTIVKADISSNTLDSTLIAKISPNNIAQNGASAGQALVWDATKGAYAPRTVSGSGGSGITALTGDVTASGTGSVAATIANNAVTNAKIAANTIDSTRLAPRSVNTSELVDNAVTSVKIATGTVTSSNILDGTIDAVDIATNAISTVKIQNLAVDSTKAGNLSLSDINTSNGSIGQVPTITASGLKYRTPASGGGGSTSPAGSTGGVQYNNAESFAADTTFKYLSSSAAIELGRRETTNATGLAPVIRIKAAYPLRTSGSGTVVRDYIKFDVIDGRRTAANFKFFGESVWGVGEYYPNSIMKWGWFGSNNVNASWYSMERSYAPGVGTDSTNAWIENHLAVANAGRSQQETRLFSCTTIPNSNWSLARSQWDFRSEIFNWYTLQNKNFGSMQYNYTGSVTFSQSPGAYRFVIKSDSILKQTTIFADLYSSTAPTLAYTGFNTINFGTNTSITPSTNTISSLVSNVTGTLDITGNQIRWPDAVQIRTGGTSYSNAARVFQIGSSQTSVHLGVNNGPTSVTSANGNTGIGVNVFSNLSSSSERNVAVSGFSGRGITSGQGNTLLGWSAADQGNFSKSIIIGDSAMYNQALSNTLWIETQNKIIGGTTRSAPLISGKFANGSLRGVGIETAPANITSTFVVTGSQSGSILSISANTTLDASHNTVIVPNGSSFTVTLPSAASITGRQYRIINKTSGSITIGSYVNLAGSTVTTMATATSILVQSDGTNWQQVQ